MAARTADAKAVKPKVRLAARDPFALRYVAALLFGVAVLFGSLWRVGTVTEIAQNDGAVMSGPVWEGWIEPPAYTGKPSLYLNDQDGQIDVPEGSRISLRLYGEIGALTVAETVSQRIEGTGSAADPDRISSHSQVEHWKLPGRMGDFGILRSRLTRSRALKLVGAAERGADGVMSLPFVASDDYEVSADQQK